MEANLKDYLKYQFVSEQMRQLKNAETAMKAGLKARPKDIMLTANLRRVQEDLKALTKVVIDTGFDIVEQIEKEIDYEFQYLKRPSEAEIKGVPGMKIQK